MRASTSAILAHRPYITLHATNTDSSAHTNNATNGLLALFPVIARTLVREGKRGKYKKIRKSAYGLNLICHAQSILYPWCTCLNAPIA